MPIELISIAVLATIFLVATALPVNMGLLALAGAFVVGSLIDGLSPRDIFAGFPGDLFVTLVGITYLFAIAQKNGSVDRLVNGAARLVGGHAAAMPWVVFGVTALLTGVGALGPAAVAIIAPVALRFAIQYRLNPLLMGLMVIHGAQAGGFSPISIYGGITNQVVERAGLQSDPLQIFLASLFFNTGVALVIFFLLGGASKRRAGAGMDQAAAGEAAAASMPDAAARREQMLTFAGLAALATGALLFDVNIGLMAVCVASFLAVAAPKSQKGAIDGVAWSTVLLICGVITYIGVLEQVGTINYLGVAISSIGVPLIGALLLCYMGGVVSAFASSTALLGIIIPLAVPFLAQGQVSALGVIAAVAVSTTIVDTSPFSTNGALVVANAAPERREHLFRQLLIYSIAITCAGPLLAWAIFVLPAG